MRKARLLILVGLLFIASAVQASTVAWIDGEGRLIYKWVVADGRNDLFASENYNLCMAQIAIYVRRARSK